MARIGPLHVVAVLLAVGLAVETAYLVHYKGTTDEKVAELEERILELEFAAMEPEPLSPEAVEKQRRREYLANWPWTDDRSTHAPYIYPVTGGDKKPRQKFQPPQPHEQPNRDSTHTQHFPPAPWERAATDQFTEPPTAKEWPTDPGGPSIVEPYELDVPPPGEWELITIYKSELGRGSDAD